MAASRMNSRLNRMDWGSVWSSGVPDTVVTAGFLRVVFFTGLLSRDDIAPRHPTAR
jgi:hypothetical protein